MIEHVQNVPSTQKHSEAGSAATENRLVSRAALAFRLLREIWNLPVAHLRFHLALDPERVRSTYRYFTKPHPRYRMFANKSIGAALIDLSAWSDSGEWLRNNNASSRSSAAYRARKARGRDYVFRDIDKNDFIDDIHEINTSMEMRQGRKMDEPYLRKETCFVPHRNYRYCGVADASGKLVAYCDLGIYGNFAVVSRLLGHRDALNNGVMFLLMVEIVSRLLDEKQVQYLMYDTWFGAQPGLKSFKTKLGFAPYRAKYALD